TTAHSVITGARLISMVRMMLDRGVGIGFTEKLAPLILRSLGSVTYRARPNLMLVECHWVTSLGLLPETAAHCPDSTPGPLGSFPYRPVTQLIAKWVRCRR